MGARKRKQSKIAEVDIRGRSVRRA